MKGGALNGGDIWAIPDCIPVSVEVIDSTCIEWLKDT